MQIWVSVLDNYIVPLVITISYFYEANNESIGTIGAHSFSGHNAAVNSLWFSSKDDYLLSSSSDKSAIVWSVDTKRGKKALVIDDLKQTKASFYYSDKFIVISSANTLKFFKYELFNK